MTYRPFHKKPEILIDFYACLARLNLIKTLMETKLWETMSNLQQISRIKKWRIWKIALLEK